VIGLPNGSFFTYGGIIVNFGGINLFLAELTVKAAE
jgi:hypothetical protein